MFGLAQVPCPPRQCVRRVDADAGGAYGRDGDVSGGDFCSSQLARMHIALRQRARGPAGWRRPGDARDGARGDEGARGGAPKGGMPEG